MWVMNLGKPVNIPTLNETMAIELGANLIGEGIIFIIAATIVYSEYERSGRKERLKEEARQEEITRLNMILEDLYFQSEKQDAQIRELTRTVNDLKGRVIHKPWTGSKPPPPPPSPPPPHNHNHPPLLPVPGYDAEGTPLPIKDKVNNNKALKGSIILQALDYFENEVQRKSYHISDS